MYNKFEQVIRINEGCKTLLKISKTLSGEITTTDAFRKILKLMTKT